MVGLTQRYGPLRQVGFTPFLSRTSFVLLLLVAGVVLALNSEAISSSMIASMVLSSC
jgi:uncharacterized membrane protein (DUF106 family)